jgi:hypothetical protein
MSATRSAFECCFCCLVLKINLIPIVSFENVMVANVVESTHVVLIRILKGSAVLDKSV